MTDEPAPERGRAGDGSELQRQRRLLIGGSVVALVAAAIAVTALILGSDGSESGAQATSGGEAAPEVSFESFDGNTASLADYRGKLLVVNFWASWCPPCIAEMPEFEEVHQKLGGEVAFLGINTQDTPEAAAVIAEETGVSYDLARDPEAELFGAFQVFGMPSTFFISPEGEILDRFTGATTGEQLEQKIRELLL